MLVPPGSDLIAQWAATRGLSYVPRPDEEWFRQWEPYATITPPTAYYNACTWTAPGGHVCIAEPWYAPEGEDPLDRTLLGFGVHSGIGRRAAMRVGEHFLTRVVFLEGPPPPRVKLGDALWDQHVTTFAASVEDAKAAFHPALRAFLAARGFQGHLELRARGGLVVHLAGVRPIPAGYERMLAAVLDIVAVAAAR